MKDIQNRVRLCFVRWILWTTKMELAIAETCSSNLRYIQSIREDIQYWEKELKLMEVNHGQP